MKRIGWIFVLLLSSIPASAGVDRFIPDHLKIQYAGNIGFLSAGTGFSFFNDRLEADGFYGYVPEKIGGKDIHMITQKNTFSPFYISLGNSYRLYPLTAGFFVNYAIGRNYVLNWPSHYPDNYYHPTACYTGEFIGVRLKKREDHGSIDAFEIYVEIVTLTPYLYECAVNDCIRLRDITGLAIGSSVHF